MRKECETPLLRIVSYDSKGIGSNEINFKKVKLQKKYAKNKPQKPKLSILRTFL